MLTVNAAVRCRVVADVENICSTSTGSGLKGSGTCQVRNRVYANVCDAISSLCRYAGAVDYSDVPNNPASVDLKAEVSGMNVLVRKNHVIPDGIESDEEVIKRQVGVGIELNMGSGMLHTS